MNQTVTVEENSAPLGPIVRVKMPRRDDGKRVGDKYACGYGHLHPSRAHAIKCRRRQGGAK